ncbi:MAG: hypothetical protein ACI9TY_001839 [Alphaproteobacteria bacterium]|jgi:hypothetical protein
MKKTHTVPTIQLADKGYDQLYKQAPASAKYLLQEWATYFGDWQLKRDDFISKLMLKNKNFAYKTELEAIKPAVGLYSLNFNRYLGCTTAIKDDIFYRTLDVSAPALGTSLHKTEKNTPYGTYINLTWPGFVGVATAYAPKRFALAYNEAPQPVGWLLNIIKIIFSKDIPPLWLTRQVLENCKNYDQAKEMLINTPLCTNAIYTLMGMTGEGCIIERTANEAKVRELSEQGYVSAGNHWQNDTFKGRVATSKKSSYERCIFMEKFLRQKDASTAKPFAWLKQPIAGDTTRFACEIKKEGHINIRTL